MYYEYCWTEKKFLLVFYWSSHFESIWVLTSFVFVSQFYEVMWTRVLQSCNTSIPVWSSDDNNGTDSQYSRVILVFYFGIRLFVTMLNNNLKHSMIWSNSKIHVLMVLRWLDFWLIFTEFLYFYINKFVWYHDDIGFSYFCHVHSLLWETTFRPSIGLSISKFYVLMTILLFYVTNFHTSLL